MAGLHASILSAHPDRKPNLIFDVTLKDLVKLQSISSTAKMLGYNIKNVHIVWVVNDVEVAIQQNKNRSRVVPDEILMNTHRGVSMTMKDIISLGDSLKSYMDGDIHLVFNKRNVDKTVKTTKKGYTYTEPGKHIKLKSSGHKIDFDKLSKDIRNKINQYTPDVIEW